MAKHYGYAVSTRAEGYKMASNIHVCIYVGRPLTARSKPIVDP
jgi:hypothetical protein